jgi:hypothetical protein
MKTELEIETKVIELVKLLGTCNNNPGKQEEHLVGELRAYAWVLREKE